MTDLRERLRRLAGSRYGPMTVARVLDQAAMGVITLVLAARLEVSVFGAASVLLIVASLAGSIADGGRSLAIIRLADDTRIGADSLRAMRLLNLAAAIVAAAIGLLVLDGTWQVVVGTAGIVWGLTAEQTIGRAAMIATRQERRCARVEITAAISAVFVLVFVGFDHPVGALPASLCARSIVVAVGARRALAEKREASGGESVGSALVLSQALGYAIANVDYVIALVMLGPGPLGLYLLGFRVANLAPAQLSSALWPVALNELAGDVDAGAVYRRLLRSALWIGVLGALATIALSPLLPVVLGERWGDVVPVVILLAPAIPFRLTFGLAGSVFVARGQERALVRYEVIRLLTTASALAVGAIYGLGQFAAAATGMTIIAHGVLHHMARRLLSIRGTPWRLAAALVSCEIVLVLALAEHIE